MSDNNNQRAKAIEKISVELGKLQNGLSTAYFFVIDSKGNPNGSVEYVYKVAKTLQESGTKVCILYQERLVDKKDEMGETILDENGKAVKEDPFVGVGGWMGEDYANIPHINSFSEDVSMSPSDVLFIPEMYASVMKDTRNFPCKRVAIVSNYGYLLESLPIGDQWANYGIQDAIVPTQILADQIKDIFPYVNVAVVNPFIDDFYSENKPNLNKLIVNVICKKQDDIIKVINPFYWKFPMFKWVVFRELRGLPQDMYASALKEGAITLYINDETTFGFGALEAMAAGNIVVGKLPNLFNEWLYDKENNSFNTCGYWTDDLKAIPTILANVIRMWITDQIDDSILDGEKVAYSQFTKQNTSAQIISFYNQITERRAEELQSALNKLTAKEVSND